ncbi:hypothetical protein [Micromonospora andamanensis]|uniref:hypothetical protein n=1 Tax=Micromonospora andamanensis TaxID=1287068 RepID=UPI00194F343C|nr:hypothetical protein [Micromonospora andamanensis]GIJ36712.1 hypothetical protein Vwe01_00370 [Micromonospora andamanensis]
MSRTVRRPGRPAVLPHRYVRQDGVPADPWTDLAPCATCNKLGRPGDAQHPDTVLAAARTEPAIEEAARELEARILGERE